MSQPKRSLRDYMKSIYYSMFFSPSVHLSVNCCGVIAQICLKFGKNTENRCKWVDIESGPSPKPILGFLLTN